MARYLDGPAVMTARVGELDRRIEPSELDRLFASRRRIFMVKVRPGGGVAPHERHLRQHVDLAGPNANPEHRGALVFDAVVLE